MRHAILSVLLFACGTSARDVEGLDTGTVDTGPECSDGHIEECPSLEICCGPAIGGCAVEMHLGGWLACDDEPCTETLEAVCLRRL